MGKIAQLFAVWIVLSVLVLNACQEPDDIVVKGECLTDEQCQGRYKNKTYHCNDQFACEALSCTEHKECWTKAQDITYYCDDSGATAVCTPFKCENDGDCVERFGTTEFVCNLDSKTCELSEPESVQPAEDKIL